MKKSSLSGSEEDRVLLATVPMSETIESKLARRSARPYVMQRLGIERDHEEKILGQRINFFHLEDWYSIHSVIRSALRVSGLYWRGMRNAERVQIRHNSVCSRKLPDIFRGFTLLHLSDLHLDTSEGAMRCLEKLLPTLDYDICVMTGDYRGATFGAFAAALEGMKRIRSLLPKPVYAVLGNHDTIRMVPAMEEMGIRMLLNECECLSREGASIHLAGVDDAHFYRLDNIEKAAADIPQKAFSILLSHTPEVYRHAAHAGFDLLLSGHTHGGQICLPGSIPIRLAAVLPRHLGAGAWTYNGMAGYTSVGAGTSIVSVRLNCLPEITLHHLDRTD